MGLFHHRNVFASLCHAIFCEFMIFPISVPTHPTFPLPTNNCISNSRLRANWLSLKHTCTENYAKYHTCYSPTSLNWSSAIHCFSRDARTGSQVISERRNSNHMQPHQCNLIMPRIDIKFHLCFRKLFTRWQRSGIEYLLLDHHPIVLEHMKEYATYQSHAAVFGSLSLLRFQWDCS